MVRRWAMIKIEKKNRDTVKITISKNGRPDAETATDPTKRMVAEKGDKSFTFHGNSTIRTSATPLKAR
jgi:hypothetical protein